MSGEYNAVLEGDRDLISFVLNYLQNHPEHEVVKENSHLVLKLTADDFKEAAFLLEEQVHEFLSLYLKMYRKAKVEVKAGFESEASLVKICYS